MNKALTDLLRKLVEARPQGLFTDEEWTRLEELGLMRKAQTATGPRPLWAYIREQAFRFGQLLSLELQHQLEQDFDPILLDAGCREARWDSSVSRRAAEVTREDLVRSVRKHLANENTMTRAHAALLVGLGRLDELVEAIVDSLKTGREDRASWGQPVIVAGLRSLIMLEHPQAATLARRYLGHEDYRLKQTALLAQLTGASQLSDAELAGILDQELDATMVCEFPDVIVRAHRGGFDPVDRLRKVIEQHYASVDLCRAVMRICLEAELTDFYRELAGHADRDWRGAAAVQPAWTSAGWTREILRPRLDEEPDDYVQTALVATLISLEPDERSFFGQMIASDKPGERRGAAWAALGRPELTDELQPLYADENDQVRFAAHCVQAANAPQRSVEHIELKWFEQSKLPDWWEWLIAKRGLHAAGITPVPPALRDFDYCVDARGFWRPGWLDEARAFYGAHPELLVKWLYPDLVANPEGRMRNQALAALVERPLLDGVLERRLEATDYLYEAGELYLSLKCVGGPSSLLSQVAGRLAQAAQDRPVEVPEEAFVETVGLALRGDSQVRARATASLRGFGERSEPWVALLLDSELPDVARAAATVAGQLQQPVDPLLADAARLLNGDVRRLAELSQLALLARSPAVLLRTKVAETAGLPENTLDEVKPFLLRLAGDPAEEISTAAIGSLVTKAGQEPWVRAVVLERSRSQGWMTRRHAVDMMVQIASWEFVPRLLELLPPGDDVTDRAVKALNAIARRYPEHGLVVFDIRDPRRVNERYAMDEPWNYGGDQRAEALRLLLTALDRKKDEAAIKKARGQKLMLQRATGVSETQIRSLAADEFDALALHLKVSFADEETGAIVAEVGEEPTGEVLNALLQTDSVVVTSAAWS